MAKGNEKISNYRVHIFHEETSLVGFHSLNELIIKLEKAFSFSDFNSRSLRKLFQLL